MGLSYYSLLCLFSFCWITFSYFSWFEYITLLYFQVFDDNLVVSTLLVTKFIGLWWFLCGFGFFLGILGLTFNFWKFFLMLLTFVYGIIPQSLYIYNNIYNWGSFEWFDTFIEQIFTVSSFFMAYCYWWVGVCFVLFYVYYRPTKKNLLVLSVITGIFWLLTGGVHNFFFGIILFVMFNSLSWLLYSIKTTSILLVRNKVLE